jgi:HAMP domain-containing protein
MRMSATAGIGILLMSASGAGWAQSQAAPAAAPASAASVAEDIRDIRAPKSMLEQAPVTLWVIAGAAVLLIGGYAVWRWQRNRVRVVVLLPFEFALQRLDATRAMMRTETGRQFGGAVSDIVRQYIERQFNVTLTQRTTEEFMQSLMSEDNSPLAPQRPLLAEFLQQSDVIKFAGGSLALQDLEALLQTARRLVQETARTAKPS